MIKVFVIGKLFPLEAFNATTFFFQGATQLDDFPDDLRSVVHEHWGKYPPQHPLIKDAFGLLYGMLFIVAFCGNTCVIFVFSPRG